MKLRTFLTQLFYANLYLFRYSMEIVLYCIEIMQFQKYITGKTLSDSEITDSATHIDFPNVPNSEIIEMEEDNRDSFIQSLTTSHDFQPGYWSMRRSDTARSIEPFQRFYFPSRERERERFT